MDVSVGPLNFSRSTLAMRPYQQRIVDTAVDLLGGRPVDQQKRHEPAASSILIESPTGSGKTIMALSIARILQQTCGMSVGWVAMRRNLLAQADAENRRWGFGVKMTLISMFDKYPPACELLIVDEAQHDGALCMANLHGVIKPKKVVGLSATPFRSDRFKLCFEKVIRDAGIHRLIQDGYLSPYHHYTVPEYTPEAVAETYLREPDRWGQSLVFFHRLDECLECERRFAGAGFGVEVVTAQTDRERQIEDFVCGRTRVLINMLILSEGFDCAGINTVFCRPSGKLCTIQMAGRVFRKHPDRPFKQIVQCDRTRHPFPRTATPAEQYRWMDSGWRALKANRQIDAICMSMQALLAQTNVMLPPYLNSRPPNSPRQRELARGALFPDSTEE